MPLVSDLLRMKWSVESLVRAARVALVMAAFAPLSAALADGDYVTPGYTANAAAGALVNPAGATVLFQVQSEGQARDGVRHSCWWCLNPRNSVWIIARVDGSFAPAPASSGGPALPRMDVRFTPLAWGLGPFSQDGSGNGTARIEFAPMRVTRNIAIRENFGLQASAIGFSLSYHDDINRRDAATYHHDLPPVQLLATIAVNALSLRIADFATSSPTAIIAWDPVTIRGMIGALFTADPRVSVRLAATGSFGLGIGGMRVGATAPAMGEDAFSMYRGDAHLQAALTVAVSRDVALQWFVQGGVTAQAWEGARTITNPIPGGTQTVTQSLGSDSAWVPELMVGMRVILDLRRDPLAPR